jgi:hypothetical protein
MTVKGDVEAFIVQRRPNAICDDCITNALGLSVRQHANHKTRELALEGGFERSLGNCGICGSQKQVIRYRIQ